MRAKIDIKKQIDRRGGQVITEAPDGLAFIIPFRHKNLCCIVSWGLGWDHASIHGLCEGVTSIPLWRDMCEVKDVVFHSNECVVQYHPPKEVYKNDHPEVLHLWKDQKCVFITPPRDLV